LHLIKNTAIFIHQRRFILSENLILTIRKTGENVNPVFRFAPSPTGSLHVGGARTAIFNWLSARKYGGTFLIRIEDTDKKRSTKEAVDQIFTSLKWLGLDWDDEPVYQSRRRKRHLEIVNRLLEEGNAYRCFCTKNELAAKRIEAEKKKINKRYDGACRRLDPDEIQHNLEQQKPYTVRFKVPAGETVYDDLIHGRIKSDNNLLDDFVVLRSDGTPVYQAAVAADDHDMGVTTVLRGDDHIPNTNKQIMLYEALGWPVPKFGHVPLILGPDKVRLSKRHGSASVEEFDKEGILPSALFNYLCLLGWAPGDDQEVFSREEMTAAFSIERINKTTAVFDAKKLRWMNSRYIAALPGEMLKTEVKNWMQQNDLGPDIGNDQERIFYFADLLRPRSETISELLSGLTVFFNDPQEYEEKGVKKYFFKEEFIGSLKKFYQKLKDEPEVLFLDTAKIEKYLREYAEKENISPAKIIHPLRLAITGSTAGPGIFDMIYILGRDKVLKRTDNALKHVLETAAI